MIYNLSEDNNVYVNKDEIVPALENLDGFEIYSKLI